MAEIAIEAESLFKRYGDVVALNGVDLQVPTGTILGLLGPNGAGKTTAVRILTTTLTPGGGTARVLGRDVVREPEAVRGSIGLAGQFAAVDGNLTGRENLALIGKLTHMPRAAISGRVTELLEQFGLTDAADRPVRTYSGGMRRRLDLAAALVHRPPVLFLDEPTTGLDISSRTDLWAVIEDLVADGTTVLLTTQYLEEADRLADRIVVIDHGEVIAEGTAAELKADLGTTVVEIGFATDRIATRARNLLCKAAIGCDVDQDGSMLRMKVDDGPRVLLAALRELDAKRVNPVTVAVREPSLDDVFLALTGHRAEEPDPARDSESAEAPARGAA